MRNELKNVGWDWLLYCIVVLSLLAINICFHYDVYHTVVISSLWKAPCTAWTHYYFPKFAPCLLLGSMVFVIKRKWWLLFLFALVDCWVISNLFYFRANGLVLTWEAIMMASNLQGFESSVIAYASVGMLKYIVISIMMIPTILLYNYLVTDKNRRWKSFGLAMMLGFFSVSMSGYMQWHYITHIEAEEFNDRQQTNSWDAMYGRNCWQLFAPYVSVWKSGEYQLRFNPDSYVRQQSIIQYFFDMQIRQLAMTIGDGSCEMGELPEDVASRFYIGLQSGFVPDRDLYIILVESLESWPLGGDTGILKDVMPNVKRLIAGEHVFYADCIRTEVRHGVSGDGQMIVNTGLLPIANGAACILYKDNVYPNFAHFYQNSAIVNPCPGEWGQDKVTYGYGYKELIEPLDKHWRDGEVLRELVKLVDNTTNEYGCYMAITVSSHTPFDRVSSWTMDFPENMPSMMAKYLNCLHFTDSCIGTFLSKMETNERLRNATIVITGDHTVWKSSTLRDLQEYATTNGFSIPIIESYTPLIIYSPVIDSSVVYTELAYQMDIFPTIMSVIGCKDYYWKGFGADLWRGGGRIPEKEAFAISNDLIRSNYFKTITTR